jgi:hypothetical protein
MKTWQLGAGGLVVCSLALAVSLGAQEFRVSPHETVVSVVDGATITITYGRPSMRGRLIFGGLISYGRIWMPGADEATIVTTTADLQFGDVRLPAGSYSLYTLTDEANWKFIINAQTGQFHTEYHADRDVVRLDARREPLPEAVERLTISAVPDAAGGGRLQLEWETTRFWVPFTVPR